ncbi:hypothetical protein PLESTM_000175400 [Pleodorina starrii]|nr:hypothetical protein PLESTM_000175400 [Pleodorina starrii]
MGIACPARRQLCAKASLPRNTSPQCCTTSSPIAQPSLHHPMRRRHRGRLLPLAAASSDNPPPEPHISISANPDTTNTSTSSPTSPTSINSDMVVILVEPKRGENIGAAARGMKNFGLRELRLVRPAGGEWPNEKARAVAARAVDVIDAAKVYDTLDAALADLQYVYAASGRPRAQDKLAKDVVLLRQVQEALPPAGTRIGIMFGREDNGLYNEELVRANAILTIDTDPNFYSLNLGQAVLIVCYELFRAPRRPGLGAKRDRASRHEVEGMLGRLFTALESRSFFNPYNRDVLQFAIRGFFDRVNPLSRQDVAAVRQVLKALQRPPSPPPPPSSSSSDSPGNTGEQLPPPPLQQQEQQQQHL